MGNEHIYWNTPTDRVSKKWGVVVLSADAATYVSSQQCTEAWVRVKAGNSVYIAIDGVATATNGFPLGTISASNDTVGPLPMSNLSSLNVLFLAASTAWILWRQ